MRTQRMSESFTKYKQAEAATDSAMVNNELFKILHKNVRDCYLREGVNHNENCKDVVHEYMSFLQQQRKTVFHFV
eukprot:m.31043 g.31043  ORF g.31043 m.31043 type:complete len:75 (+) comp41543_c0_seq1:50-274(+)